MPYPDYHVHSLLSFDGLHTVLEMAKAGIERGLPELGFTEHLELEPSNDAFGFYDYERSREAVEEAQSLVGSRILLRFGVEAGYDSRRQAELAAFFKSHSYDFVLGSVHSVGGLAVGRPLFEKYDLEAAYRLYFGEVLKAVESGFFDCMAHLDLPKRYGISFYGRSWNPEPFRKELTEIFKTMIELGVSLEINTSGLRQDPHDTYPDVESLELYRTLGGRMVTLGSDAHKSWDLGSGFEEAGPLASKLGFEIQRFGSIIKNSKILDL